MSGAHAENTTPNWIFSPHNRMLFSFIAKTAMLPITGNSKLLNHIMIYPDGTDTKKDDTSFSSWEMASTSLFRTIFLGGIEIRECFHRPESPSLKSNSYPNSFSRNYLRKYFCERVLQPVTVATDIMTNSRNSGI